MVDSQVVLIAVDFVAVTVRQVETFLAANELNLGRI
jgi:hypothetical protein